MSLVDWNTKSLKSPVSLPLYMVGILSAMAFALSFSLEFIVLFRQSLNHQALLLGLIICLSIWAMVEAFILRKQSPGSALGSGVTMLIIQLFTELTRGVVLLWQQEAPLLDGGLPTNGAFVIFLPTYTVIFLLISRSLLKAHAAELDKAYRTIVHMEQSALKLTEAIPVGTYVLEYTGDGDGRLSFVSERWLQMLGVNREDVMADSKIFERLIHADDFESYCAQLRHATSLKDIFQWEGRIYVKGALKWMNVEAQPRPISTGSTVYEGVIIDVTTQKKALEAIERSHEQLTQIAVDRSRSKAREQLLQDMHDGFGSQLAGARLLAERGELGQDKLVEILEECIVDLHLLTDTLNNSEGTLFDGLADLRFRTEQRTQHLPIEWLWRVELTSLPHLEQVTILHVLRICQEAINNALKHSSAHKIAVEAIASAERSILEVQIVDNGIGLPESVQYRRGLRGMQHRAREIGGELVLSSSKHGTTISMSVPFARIKSDNSIATIS